MRAEIKSGSKKQVVDIPSKDEADYEVQLRLARGKRKIDITFINDFYDPKRKIDRNLHLYHTHLRGRRKEARIRYQ